MTEFVFSGPRNSLYGVEFYDFVYSDDGSLVERYTNADFQVTIDGNVYVPIEISSDESPIGAGPDTGTVGVEIARDAGIVNHIDSITPQRLIYVKIYRTFRPVIAGEVDGEVEMRVMFTGRVAELEYSGDPDMVSLKCAQSGHGLKSPGLTRTYARKCELALYRGLCGANKAAATVAAEVASTSGRQVTLVNGWLISSQRLFVGGILEWDSAYGRESRRIIAISTNLLTLDGPTTGIVAGTVVSVIRGCARTIEDCSSHNNIQRYGGCFAIPEDNPVGKNNHSGT